MELTSSNFCNNGWIPGALAFAVPGTLAEDAQGRR